MTLDEAYQEAMDVVTNLQRAGIKVKLKPANSQNDPRMIAKYSGPERLPPSKWYNVAFFPETDEQKEMIYKEARNLGWLGIYFDNGGTCGRRDWELDWSFRYTGQIDGELEAKRQAVEDIFDEMGN